MAGERSKIIGPLHPLAMFRFCTNLLSIEVDPLNFFFSSLDGVLFDISQSTLLRCPEGRIGNYAVPTSVSLLGERSFEFCAMLSDITIPDNVWIIGPGAFSGCSGLNNVTIPDSISTIPRSAFQNCTSLTNVTIGNSVVWIEGAAFAGCSSLTSMRFPRSVAGIWTYAFEYCTSLNRVYFEGPFPDFGWDVFFGIDDLTGYYLPGAEGWPWGWEDVFYDRPSTPWYLSYPLILDFPPTFGVQNDQFGFIISWATNAEVVVEASTDLSNPAWSPISTNSITIGVDPTTDGWAYFTDPDWTNYPRRFYRLQEP